MDAHTSGEILHFVQNQGYILIFLAMYFEGTLLAFAAGFAASLGDLNIFIVLGLATLGNFLGDIGNYFIGRYIGSERIKKKWPKRGFAAHMLETWTGRMREHPGKVITFVKLVPPLPVPGIMLAGASHVRLRTFLFYSFIVTVGYSFFFVLWGYYAGQAFSIILHYIRFGEYLASLFGFILLVGWVLGPRALSLLSKKLETSRFWGSQEKKSPQGED